MENRIEDGWVEVDGLRVHCLKAGERNVPVLLLHGGGYDSASLSYKHAVGPISEHHRVFAPDWPGYGESDKPEMQYSTEYYVGFLGRLMDALSMEKASLVGISMGGAIALGFSLRSPQRVDKLVLVDSHGLGGEVPGGVASYVFVRLPLLNKLVWAALGRSRRMVRASLQTTFYDPRAITENLVNEVYELVKKPRVGQAWRSWQKNEIGREGLRTNFVNRLHELAVPTLILHGAEDKYVPDSWALRAHTLIKDSELHIFPQCGHWLTLERPGEFDSAVLEFLARR
ncbi:MAG TPA: alpha/beta fold hydrolase [Rubrobacteraceae bacterium]|nr:alpha/beta fold hydrolase [Rubrobacteraceae bacterium]